MAKRQKERAKGSLGMPSSGSTSAPPPKTGSKKRPKAKAAVGGAAAANPDKDVEMEEELETGHEPSSSSTSKPPQDTSEKLEVVTIPVGMPTGGMLRNLQKGGMPAMRSIMEMHRRHYHMPVREVHAVMKRAGIDPTTIDEVPKVISTCEACQD